MIADTSGRAPSQLATGTVPGETLVALANLPDGQMVGNTNSFFINFTQTMRPFRSSTHQVFLREFPRCAVFRNRSARRLTVPNDALGLRIETD